MIAAGGLTGLSLILLATYQAQFWAFAVLYVVGFGFCNGMTYMVPVHHGWLWFPERPGLVSGLVIGGFGLGALIYNSVCQSLINPENVSVGVDGRFPDEINEKFPTMMRTIWLCWLSMAAVSMLLIHSGEAEEDGLWDIVAARLSPRHNNSSSSLREDQLRNLDDGNASRPNGECEAKYTPLTQAEGVDDSDPIVIQKDAGGSHLSARHLKEKQPLDQTVPSVHSFTEQADESYLHLRDKITKADRARLRIHRDYLLFKKCLQNEQFWIVYLMACLSILFGYYSVDVFKSFG